MKKTIFALALTLSINFSGSQAQANDYDSSNWFNNTVNFMNDNFGPEGSAWSRIGWQDDADSLRDVVRNNVSGDETTFWYSSETGAAAGAVIAGSNGRSTQYDACGAEMSWWDGNGNSGSSETSCDH